MKKELYRWISATLLLITATSFTACDDSYRGIENKGEVKILSFTAPGSKLDKLDEANDFIELILSSETDLQSVMPQFTLSDGAHLALPENPNGPVDLSKVMIYRVVNKNLYHDYKVIAKQVADITSFYEMSINGYRGIIDNDARTILIRMPLGTDVTALTPKFQLSEGAELIRPLQPTHDFTHPVDYSIKYLDEQFTYTVKVELVDFRKVAFLGAYATSGEISHPDDKSAYEWFDASFPVSEYLSFADIRAGKDLSGYAVIWYHYDSYDKGGDPVIHPEANKPEVIEALKGYLAQGGGLFLSSAGLTLGNVLDIAQSGGMWNNAWGYERTEPFEVNDGNGYGWGLRIKGNEDHPIFQGLRMAPGEKDRFFLLSNGCQVLAHNAVWNFADDWTGWEKDVTRWEKETGAKQLASFHWDDQMNERCLITEYPATDERGPVITTGAEMYDWYQEGGSPNTFRDNLEKLTYNILNYLSL